MGEGAALTDIAFEPVGGREAINVVTEHAAENDYGMMGHNAASKYFETHPRQEFIAKRNDMPEWGGPQHQRALQASTGARCGAVRGALRAD